MHRTKIGLIAAGILLAFTAGMYFSVTSDLKTSVNRTVEDRVSRAQRLYHQISRVEGLDFGSQTQNRARKAAVVAIADIPDLTARREAAYQECEVLNTALQKEPQGKAAIVAILDSTGKVLARDLNPNAMYGEDLAAQFPAVKNALKGEATTDVWTLSNRMTRVALAPITKPDSTIVGALLVGYVMGAKQAQENRDLLGVDVGYFHGGKMHASSFMAEDNGKEDTGKTTMLSNLLFQSEHKYADVALQKGSPTEVFRTSMDGKDFAAVAAPLPGNFADKTSGFVVLASISDGAESVDAAGMRLLAFGLVAIVIALAASGLTAKRFIKPLDKIELGVAEIINGNIDYTFKPVGPDFEGLSNGLNVMLARLLGRDEVDEDAVEEEDSEAKKWKAEQMIIQEGDGAPAPASVGQESEAAYYPRLFNEYVTALRNQGKPSQGVSIPAFMAKLRLTEGGLRQKWECRMVRFKVVTEGSDVVFKAQRVQ